MIYTLTLNPSIDYIVTPPALIRGGVNRSDYELLRPAGKGINVSLSLTALGVENTPVTFKGSGFAGEEFARLLNASGDNPDGKVENILIPVAGCDTRINVKIKENGAFTEINGNFAVDKRDVTALGEILAKLTDGDTLVISGSLPRGIPPRFCAQTANSLTDKGVRVIVDTSGEPLREVVKSSLPFLIKPNRQELGELFCVEINSFDDAVKYAKLTGCPNVLVSMGELGAVLITYDDVYTCHAPECEVNYTVGAGDALLAGFIAEYINSECLESALSAGVDASSKYVMGELL